jgi:dolichyl-phosphate beta-glucosyltransferase
VTVQTRNHDGPGAAGPLADAIRAETDAGLQALLEPLVSELTTPATESSTVAISRLDLEIVVPAFNEESRLEATLVALSEVLAALPLSCGISVVDNGSADRTAECVDRFQGGPVPITLIGCAVPGKGAAVSRGILASTAKWVGFCDADLATPAVAIVEAVALLRTGVDVVVGSRRCEGASFVARQPALRRLGGAGFRWLTRDLAGSITDTQCGFKFFDGDVARRLFAASALSGFVFDLEIVARTHRSGFQIVEMPVAWEDRPGSTFHTLRDSRRVWSELRRLRQELRVPTAVAPGAAAAPVSSSATTATSP